MKSFSMHPKRKRRFIMVLLIVTGSAIAAALALFALQQDINLYYTPTQVFNHQVPKNRLFRMGGIVKTGSVHHAKKGLAVQFVLTDCVHDIPVDYNGVLPDLFRVGQGIVAQGQLNAKGVFVADQVLAKHGANYMPPPVRDALAAAKKSS